jgi:DNA-binding winged helix-turn-helix (wHTH) protein/TolB-like protein/Flp pilus assembly protein TadD
MGEQINRFYEFGPFRLIPAERQLLRDTEPVALPPKAFDTLLMLVEQSGHIVKKDDLIRRVWPDAFIEENNLNQCVSLLRKALAGGNDGEQYIETVRGFGYRFTADVRQDSDETNAFLLHKHTRTRLVVREQTSEAQSDKQIVREAPFAADSFHPLHRQRLVFGVLIAATALAGLAIAAFFLRASGESTQSLTTPAVHSIAVLPFQPLGNDGRDEYLGLGVADALINKLGQLKQINVRSTGAIQKYADGERDPVIVGRELNVDAVLDGRIQKSGEKVRVTVQLVRVQDGGSLWAEKFDQEFSSVFAAEDAIVWRVSHGLIPVLNPQDQIRLSKQYTDNQEAYEAYLKGRYLWNKRTTDSVRQSIEYFRQALEKDPNFALAYVGLADAYLIDDVTKAEPALRRALELDDTLGEAHASLGFYRMFWHWDWQAAEPEFERAIELNPNYATAHQWYALYLAVRQRRDEATKEMRQAVEIDPHSPNLNADLGQLYYFAHEYDQAITQCRNALKTDPDFHPAHEYLFLAYMQKSMYAEAVEEYLKSQETHTSANLTSLRDAFVKSGWRGFLKTVLKQRRAKDSTAFQAVIYAQLGNKERAIRELERAYDAGDFFLTFIQVEPAYDELRADPRFQDLRRRMNLGTRPNGTGDEKGK